MQHENHHEKLVFLDPDAVISPLFEVKLFVPSKSKMNDTHQDSQIRHGLMYFEPSLEVLCVDETSLEGSFARLMYDIIEDILNMATLLKRISQTTDSSDYRETMMDFLETEQLRMDLIERLPGQFSI